MQHTGRGRAFGLPKEVVAAMLGVALVVTVAVDLSGAPGSARAVGSSVAGGLTHAHLPSTTTSAVTAPPATPPTTVAGPPAPSASPPPPGSAGVPRAAARPAPRPKPRPAPRPGPAPARTVAAIPLGAYVGSGDPAGLASFAAATGTHPAYASDYLPRTEGWAGITGADGTLSWITRSWRGSGKVLILGVPMIPADSSGTAQGTLAAGAAGQYNASFVSLASGLVSGGAGNAVLRLGWEFNGNWYPWNVTDATDATNFVAYFRNIVNAMRSVPGQAFRFVWNPNAGGSYGSAYGPAQTYPGSAYVDYIGTDLYDESWSSPAAPPNAWAGQLGGAWGLDWLAAFAAQQGRPIVIPEWGVDITSDGHGMGDDPYFIDQMGTWIVQHNVAWTSYFNYDAPDGSHDLLDASFAQSLGAFRAMFG